jgi:predicted ATPase/DNA-binding CsgD family transcriptional regulator
MADILAPIQRPGAASAAGYLAPGMPVAGPIVGRDREIAQILALLDSESVRVLSLLGPGGVGKTRLAQEVVRQASGDFAHGAAFVSLAQVRISDLVPFAVAQALGVQERGEVSLTVLLAEWLQPRHMLLVLDNMEHVVDAAYPWLANLIATCPRLKILVTSRVALDIAGEQRFHVKPLPVPGDDATGRLDENASVALFTQRARAVQNDFSLDDDTQAVASICIRVDGLPLAIELAAARVNVLSPGDILSRLTESFALLAGTRRDVPPRLRSLRDAIAWSYDLLSPDEQDLFRRLAVFIGGFSLEAAEAVGAEPQSQAARPVADVVATLVDHSLVERVDGVSRTRFRMLETIREFGIARLAERDELAMARGLHAAYCQQLAEAAETGLQSPDQATWLELIDVEHGNLREAMDWLTTSGRVSEAIELYRNIEHFWLIHAHFAEVRHLLDGWSTYPDVGPGTRARAHVLAAGATLATFREAPESSIPAYLEALEMFRQLGDRQHVMKTLNSLTFSYAMHGDPERARAAHEEHLALARELGDAWQETMALGSLAIFVNREGDPIRERSALEATLARARQAGNQFQIALALERLGELTLHDEGDPGRARALIEESRMVRERLGDRRNLSLIYLSLALVHRASEDLDRAREHAHKAVSLARGTGLVTHEGAAHTELGMIALLQHDLGDALLELRQALESFRGSGSGFSPEVADCLDTLAAVALQLDDAEAAARFLGASDGLIHRAGLPRCKTWPADYRQALAAHARTALDAETFERCHAAARDWSIDEAIATALAFDPALETPDHAGTPVRPHGLSPREIEVLRLMADGLSNREIADALFVSVRTVTSHITGILGKLDLSSRTQAVAYAIRNNIA